MYETFINYYGHASPGTAVSPQDLGFQDISEVRQFIVETGGGVFKEGFLSICSVREHQPDLGGWEAWLPEKSRILGTSALGFMFALSDHDLWVVDTQYGQVIEVGISISEFLNHLAEPNVREDFMRESLFLDWLGNGMSLPHDCVLSPVPAMALGGDWGMRSFKVTSFSVYLSFTAQLFSTDVHQVEIRRL